VNKANTDEICRNISTRLSVLPLDALTALDIVTECHALMNRSIETALLTAIPLLINKTGVAEDFANKYINGYKTKISRVLDEFDVRHLTFIKPQRMAEEVVSFLFFSPINISAWDLFYAGLGIGSNSAVENIRGILDTSFKTIETHAGLLSLSCNGSIDPFIKAVNLTASSLVKDFNTAELKRLKAMDTLKGYMQQSTDSCNDALPIAKTYVSGLGSGGCVKYNQSDDSCVAPDLKCEIFSTTFNSTADLAIFDLLAKHFDGAVVNSLLDKLNSTDMKKELLKVPGLNGEIKDLPNVIGKIRSKVNDMKTDINDAKNADSKKASVLRKYFGPSNLSVPVDDRPLHMNPCQSANNVLEAWTDTRRKIEDNVTSCRLYPSDSQTSQTCASVFANNSALNSTVGVIFDDVRRHLTSFKDDLSKLVASTQCRSLGNNVNDAVDALCSQTLDGVDSIATALWLLGICCIVMTAWACFLPMFVIPLHNEEEEEEEDLQERAALIFF